MNASRIYIFVMAYVRGILYQQLMYVGEVVE